MSKFVLCRNGWHYWPEHLSEYVGRCCINNPVQRPENMRPDYLCHLGEHGWIVPEKAVQCCNTHIRVWVDVKDPWFKEVCGKQWQAEREMVLMPLTDFMKMDEKATAHYRLAYPKLFS